MKLDINKIETVCVMDEKGDVVARLTPLQLTLQKISFSNSQVLIVKGIKR